MRWEDTRRWPFGRCTLALVVALAGLAACSPGQAAAQRTERFALAAHAGLGLGGRFTRCSEFHPDSGAFGCPTFGEWREPLRPSPGLGLRLSFVGWRYLSLGLAVSLRSLATERSNVTRFTDVGVMIGARYPLELGRGARLVTPYVAGTVGLTTMHAVRGTDSRLQDPGYHVSGVAGLEVELVPGLGVYVEAGITRLRIHKERPNRLASSLTVEATQAVLHLGLRVAR